MEREVEEKLKELYELQRKLLMKVVGTSYNTQKALEIQKQIELIKKKK